MARIVIMYVFCLCFLAMNLPFLNASVNSVERQIASELNPGCTIVSCNETYNIVHVAATGPSDTLHFLWDLSRKPTVLLALTSHTANMSIDWQNFGMEKSVTFSEEPSYSFGVVLNKIWEYNDINDTGIFNQQNKSKDYVREINIEDFVWERVTYKNDSKTVSFAVRAEKYYYNTTLKNGTVQIELKGFGYLDHSDVLPHLLHTPNTTQVDFIIDGLAIEPTFRNSRFALEIVLVGSDQPRRNLEIVSRKSLDDEHAPGVFTLVDIETPMSAYGSAGGYLQWRPVAYVSTYRDVANSTETNVYTVKNVTDPFSLLNGSLLPSFYCFNCSKYLVQSTAVSFGLKEDGFYQKTNYTSWTFTMGYGKPPDEDFSLLVILVISIGLGLPALLIVISGLVMGIRRLSRTKDDLFLGR